MRKMYSAIIIDDELTARDTIELIIKKNELSIEVIGKAKDADEGIRFINKLAPEIIFLDINMPGKSGIEMLEYISTKNLQIIFTTAYDEYAIKAINLSACYYLLKPINIAELKKAVSKAIENIESKNDFSKNIDLFKEIYGKQQAFAEKIIVSNKNGYEVIKVNDIIYLKGDKNYTWIVLADGQYIASKTLKEFEDTFDNKQFFRIHQSYIINKDNIKRILNTRPDQVELSNGVKLGIARDRKKELMDWLSA